MNKEYSSTWKTSTNPSKQRKYVYNAPRNVRVKFLSCNLSKALRKEYNIRNLKLRTKDTVKVMRGEHKGKTGEIVKLDIEKSKVYVKGINRKKVNGQEVNIPLKPSNLQLIELELKDEKRLKSIKKKSDAKTAAPKAPKTAAAPKKTNADTSKETKPKATEKKDKN